jgi:lysophospholipase L1-like esterase
MNILLVGDSHCFDLHKSFKKLSSSDKVMTISVGGKIATTIMQYDSQMTSIRLFNPIIIILHLGHNDMAFHPSKNIRPRISREVTKDILAFATKMKSDIPTARIFISSILPRKSTRYSHLSSDQTTRYNKLAVRHGLRLRKLATAIGLEVLLNTIMWKRIYKEEPKVELIDEDGLHLNEDGQKVLVGDWLSTIKIPT